MQIYESHIRVSENFQILLAMMCNDYFSQVIPYRNDLSTIHDYKKTAG